MLCTYQHYCMHLYLICVISPDDQFIIKNHVLYTFRDAWTSLGNMQAEEAMLLYVDELKKVSIHVKETLYPPEVMTPAKPDFFNFLFFPFPPLFINY